MNLKHLVLVALMWISVSAQASIFNNTASHPDHPEIIYSIEKGKFFTLRVTEDEWETLDSLFLEGFYVGLEHTLVVAPDRSQIYLLSVIGIISIPLNESGLPISEINHLLSTPDDLSLPQIKLNPILGTVYIIAEGTLIHYELSSGTPTEVEFYTEDDFDIPSSSKTFIHSDGSLLDFESGKLYPYQNGQLQSPITLPVLGNLNTGDKLSENEDGDIYAIENRRNLVRIDWPISEDSQLNTIATNGQFDSISGKSSDGQLLRIQGYAKVWLLDLETEELDSTFAIGSDEVGTLELPNWVHIYHSYLESSDDNVMHYMPVIVGDSLWFGPLHLSNDDRRLVKGYQSPLYLSNNDLSYNLHNMSLDSARHNGKVSVETPIGLATYSFDESGNISNKSILEFKVNGELAHLVTAKYFGNDILAMVVEAKTARVYTQIYKNDALVSEIEIHDLGYFDGMSDYFTRQRPIISRDNNYLYVEILGNIYHCNVTDLLELSGCSLLDIEPFDYPKFDKYKDGMIYWGPRDNRLLYLNLVDNQIAINNTWDLSEAGDCCISEVFYNETSDRLFVSIDNHFVYELQQDGSYTLIEGESHSKPSFFDPDTGVAIHGISLSDTFLFDPVTDVQTKIEFKEFEALSPSLGAFRTYLGNNLFVFRSTDNIDGIEVINIPFNIKPENMPTLPSELNQYQTLTIDTSHVLDPSLEHSSSRINIGQSLDIGSDTRGIIEFYLDKEDALWLDGTSPITLHIEDHYWRYSTLLTTKIININEAPIATPVEAQVMKVNDPYGGLLDDVFTDPDYDKLTYTVSNLPPGMSLDGSYISGSPSKKGEYVVVVTATDPDGLSTMLEFTILVQSSESSNSSSGGSGGGSMGHIITFLLLMWVYRKQYRVR